jgi:hypothetical protein
LRRDGPLGQVDLFYMHPRLLRGAQGELAISCNSSCISGQPPRRWYVYAQNVDAYTHSPMFGSSPMLAQQPRTAAAALPALPAANEHAANMRCDRTLRLRLPAAAESAAAERGLSLSISLQSQLHAHPYRRDTMPYAHRGFISGAAMSRAWQLHGGRPIRAIHRNQQRLSHLVAGDRVSTCHPPIGR